MKSIAFHVLILTTLLLSACCSDMDTYYMWKIENHSADTVKITFTHKSDTIIVLPNNRYAVFKDADFTCGSDFEENAYSVKVSSQKRLIKTLHLAENWERSTHVRQIYCDQRKECTFTIRQGDIE